MLLVSRTPTFRQLLLPAVLGIVVFAVAAVPAFSQGGPGAGGIPTDGGGGPDGGPSGGGVSADGGPPSKAGPAFELRDFPAEADPPLPDPAFLPIHPDNPP